MAGLIGDLAMGALGGAGRGMSENAKGDIQNIYDQMNMQMKAEMEQRIYERGRRDKTADDAAAMAADKEKLGMQHKYKLEEIEAQGRAQRKAAKDPVTDEMKKLQLDDEKKVRKEIAQHENNIKMWMEQISSDPSSKQVLLPSIQKAQARIAELRSGGVTTSSRIEQEEGMLPKEVTEVKSKSVPNRLGFDVGSGGSTKVIDAADYFK